MPEPAPDRLLPAERAFLRELARLAFVAAVSGSPPPDPYALAAGAGLPLAPRLDAPRGAFVTLTLDGRLRGCIGVIEGVLPLVQAVADNAAAAAVDDPRFRPVSPPELPRLEFEVSALTPLRRVAGPAEIEIGRHGILLSRRGRRAVFLPQVAPAEGWDLETTLTQLALKAGLAPDGWRQDAVFQVFEADVF